MLKGYLLAPGSINIETYDRYVLRTATGSWAEDDGTILGIRAIINHSQQT